MAQKERSLDDFDVALDALDQELDGIVQEPLRIRAIGGYALLKHGIRDAETEFTVDIDSVSDHFAPEVVAAIARVGRRLDMDDDWLNTANVGEEGAEMVENLLDARWDEQDTGHGNLSVAVADLPTLTRSKLAAVDTIDTNGRTKDLPDLVRLLKAQGIESYAQFSSKFPDPFHERPMAGEVMAKHYGKAPLARAVIPSRDPDLAEFADIDFDTIDSDRSLDDYY